MSDQHDEWRPTFEDEAETYDEWAPEPPDVFDEEASLDSEDPRSGSGRPPGLQIVLGAILVIMLGAVVWWTVRAVLLPAAAPTPAALWTPAPLPSLEVEVEGTAPVVSATQAPVSTPSDPSARIVVGQGVRVAGAGSQGIRFRSGPGLNFATLAVLNEGATLKAVDGPESADGYDWWHLEMEDGTVGWAAQDWLKPVTSN